MWGNSIFENTDFLETKQNKTAENMKENQQIKKLVYAASEYKDKREKEKRKRKKKVSTRASKTSVRHFIFFECVFQITCDQSVSFFIKISFARSKYFVDNKEK